MHVSGSKGVYTDEVLAKFIHNNAKYSAREDALIKPAENIFSKQYKNQKDGDEYGYSTYFHKFEQNLCKFSR